MQKTEQVSIEEEFHTTHRLDFLSAPWSNPFNTEGWQMCKVGTCHGQWRATDEAYEILTVINEVPGNGHFDDLLQWFENSCKRDGKVLKIREVWNKRLVKHLVRKRGFTHHFNDDLIKRFK